VAVECLASVFATLHGRIGYVSWPKMILPVSEILSFVTVLDGVSRVPTHPDPLFRLRFTEVRRSGEGEENHFLAG
jgi:hypothetical protein